MAQWIRRPPSKRETASSSLAGGICLNYRTHFFYAFYEAPLHLFIQIPIYNTIYKIFQYFILRSVKRPQIYDYLPEFLSHLHPHLHPHLTVFPASFAAKFAQQIAYLNQGQPWK